MNEAKRCNDLSGKEWLQNSFSIWRNLSKTKEEKGKKLIKLDKYYPSSQICNCCGNINTAINNDNIRKWICPSCGTSHNRDINAVINIKNEGIRILGIA